jgi:hypothetical protein
MSMNLVHIEASPKQLSKLRNGHSVRIKQPQGKDGYNLMIDPLKYNAVSKSFKNKKGLTIQLSPEEILHNRKLTPEYHQKIKQENSSMSGKGIFGKKFDRFVERTIGKKAKDVIYNSADLLKPKLQEGLDKLGEYAPQIASSALGGLALVAGQPELLPLAGLVGNQIGSYLGKKGVSVVKDYLDNPTPYQENMSKFVSNFGGPRSFQPFTLSGQIEQDKLLSDLNNQLGTNYGYMSRSGIVNAIANRQTSDMTQPLQQQQYQLAPPIQSMPDSYTRYKSKMRGSGVEAQGTKIRQLNHPALQSQPEGANFQFGVTLPPAYQKFHKGKGRGLYV